MVTPKIAGILYKSNTALAAHTLIRFIDADAIALPGHQVPIDSIYTDSIGRYSINSLHDGVYNAFGEKDGELYFRTNIQIKNGKTSYDTLRDTLGPAGSLCLFVKHRPYTWHRPISATRGFNRSICIN